ncbi:MAG: class I SAM-dependent methyltransferase [Myxococcota bacterium]
MLRSPPPCFGLLCAAAACASSPSAGPSSHPASHPASHPGSGPHQGAFHHSFEDAEKWAGVFDDPARAAWQKPDDVVALLGLVPGQTVADLGAGTGYFMSRLSNAVGPDGTVLALDPELNMVRYMEKRARREGLENVEARRISTDDPGLPTGRTHVVLIVDTWHHIGRRGAYAEKLAAGLAPGGAVFIVDFTLDSPEGPPREHRLTASQVAQELSQGGLEATILEEELPRQYVVKGTLKGGAEP